MLQYQVKKHILCSFKIYILGVFTFISMLVSVNAVKEKPNVCTTFKDYKHMENSSNCYYNEDIGLEMDELCAKYGYPLENYTVTTKDGYITTVFRLARPKNARGVIFLQHTAATCSTLYINRGPKYSLGFQLYDAGYDVWLPNSRGSRYARKHVWLSTDEPAYWNHTFHEMSLYDLPVQLDLVNNVTGAAPNITFLGHSMPAATGIIYSVLHPEHSKKMIKVMIGSSPHLSSNHFHRSFLSQAFFSYMLDSLWDLVLQVKFVELLPERIFKLVNFFCAKFFLGIEMCAKSCYFFMGNSYKKQVAPEWFPLMFAQNPGVATKTLWHYLKNTKMRRFQYFDYGPEGNMQMYNSTLAPLYDLKKVTIPVYFLSGDKDTLCPYQDTQAAFDQLKDEVKLYKPVILKGFNHLDFVYGRRLNLYNKHVINFLNKLYDKK